MARAADFLTLWMRARWCVPAIMAAARPRFPIHPLSNMLSRSSPRACGCEVLNFHRLDGARWFEAKYFCIKIELAIERPFDVLCLPESVLLTRKLNISDRNSFGL